MKEYIKVTHVPLLREGSRPPASLCEVLPAGGILHLRWAAEGGSVSCAVGLPDATTLEQAKLRLELDGFLASPAGDAPAKETACQILHRSVQQRYISGGAGPAQRMALPERMLPAGAFDAAFARLRSIKGCAIHLLVRRSSGLNDTVQRQLQTRQWPAESLPGLLLTEGALFEAVVCISGDPSGLLAAEVCTAFGGALTTENAAAPIDGRIFETAPCPSGVVPQYKPLCYSYLPYEAAALTSLTASAGQYGLPVNNDTLPGLLPVTTKGELLLGQDCKGSPVWMPLRNLPLGTAILGTPGSGKGNLLVTLAMQLAKKKIPTLIIESAKEELHHLRKVGVDVNTYRPVEGEFLLDPFSLPPNVTLGQYRDALLQTLRAAFRLDGPLEELFSAALDRTFAVHGFSEHSKAGDFGTTPFGLNELMQAFNTELRERGYSPKTESDMRTAGLVRLNALFNQNRPIYDTVKSIPVSEFAKGFNLFQLSSLTSIEGKQAFASLLLISISCWARLNLTHTAGKHINLVIFLDEAHNLLTGCRRTTGDEYSSFSANFTNLLLELRSLGVAIVVADQSAKNIPDVLYDICAQKFFLGQNPGSGITDHSGEMKLDEAALSHQYLLGPGEGFYKAPEMPQSVFFSSLNLIDTLKIEEPCERRNAFLEQHPRFCIESYAECESCPARGKCTLAGKAAARAIAARLSASWKGRFIWALNLPGHTPEEAAARSKALSDSLRRLLLDAREQSHGDRAIYFCAVICFFRSLNREAATPVSIPKTIGAAKTLMPE